MSRYRVRLRNGGVVVVADLRESRVAEPVGEFVYLAYGQAQTHGLGGNLEGYPVADMWRRDGCWREDGAAHQLDIVAGLEQAA